MINPGSNWEITYTNEFCNHQKQTSVKSIANCQLGFAKSHIYSLPIAIWKRGRGVLFNKNRLFTNPNIDG